MSSIRGRLLLFSAGLTAAALLTAWAGVSLLLEGFVGRRMEADLQAALRGVMAASDWRAGGEFAVSPPPADPRFAAPLSGWFWQVSDGGRILARSESLVTGDLGPAGEGPLRPQAAALVLRQARFTAPGDGRLLIAAAALPQAELERELAAIRRPLTAALLILGAALIAAQMLAVRLGLRGLARFAADVARLREGELKALPPPAAAELRPLAEELDRLTAANAETVARARAHAGNLAHALKTPLAILIDRAGPEDAALIARMDRTIRWHLKRARTAAPSPRGRASTREVLADLALVLGPEARRRGIALSFDAEAAPDFRGDAEDLTEMIGNLAENAVKWAQSAVEVRAFASGGRLRVAVRDDGPGIAAEDRARLTARGARLDEAVPGFGLGLAIVGDLCALYGAALLLEAAEGGGLQAVLDLPAAEIQA